MELRHLRYFVAVAEELHFGRAAKRLHMSQPPLSLQIRALEDELGTRLFERTNRRVVLTKAGSAFLEEAHAILESVAAASRRAAEVARGASGHLSIGFTGSAPFSTMPSLLTRFCRAWPDVSLALEQMTTMAQLEALSAGSLDVGFAYPAPAELPPRGLVGRPADRQPLLVALSSGHRLAASRKVEIAALRNEPFILPPRRVGSGLYDKIQTLCFRAGFAPRVVMEAHEISTIMTLAAVGIGVSLVFAGMRKTAIAGLSFVDIADDEAFADLLLVTREGQAAPTVRNFVGLL
jgi:DNA-binding transcriptional LysR family regulator